MGSGTWRQSLKKETGEDLGLAGAFVQPEAVI